MANKKTEWRELVNVHSIELFRSDVIELINLLLTCEDFDQPELKMIVTSDSRTIEFDPKNEDFNDFEIDKSNQIRIELHVWRDLANEEIQSKYKQREIFSSILMNMYVNHVDYHISSNSEIWFRGKKEQLTRFFNSKKPVIPNKSNNYKVFKLINNIIYFLAFILLIYFYLNGKLIFALIPFAVMILNFIILIRKPATIDHPFVMVYFFDIQSEKNTQKKEMPWNLIVNIIGIGISIIGIFISMIKK